MEIRVIDKKEFENYEHYLLFDDIEYVRQYGVLLSENHKLILGWRSDMLIPHVFEYKDHLVIGIDNSVLIINKASFNLEFKIKLNWNFQNVIFHEEQIFVVTELSVYKIKYHELTLESFNILPDIIEDFIIYEGYVSVTCLDGNQYRV